MIEIWKPVKGKEEWAEISNLGQIHYFAGKSKRYPDEHWTYGSETIHGYLNATIGGNSKGVHVWVYLTFIGEIPDGLEVNHIDENKHNNRLDNLNLMTPKENMGWGTGNARRADALRGRKRPAEVGVKVAASLSKAIQALDKVTGEVVYEFPSTAEAQRQGFYAGAISECCNGKRKSYKGFIWRYSEK